MGQIIKTETHRFEHYGDNTVSTAAQLIEKLPNGWVLKSLTYVKEYSVGSWVAFVEGPQEDLTDRSPRV